MKNLLFSSTMQHHVGYYYFKVLLQARGQNGFVCIIGNLIIPLCFTHVPNSLFVQYPYLLVHGILPVLPLLLVQDQIQGSLLLLLRILCQLHKQHMRQLLQLVFPLLLEGNGTRNQNVVNRSLF